MQRYCSTIAALQWLADGGLGGDFFALPVRPARHLGHVPGIRNAVCRRTRCLHCRCITIIDNVAVTREDAWQPWLQYMLQGYSSKDRDFDLIYINGSNNLENLKRPDDTW